MNTHRSSLLNDLRADAEDDSEVIRILDAYLSGIEAGQPADPDKLLADHPALAGPLREYLKVMNLAGRMADGADASLGVVPIDGSTDGSIPGRASNLLSTLDLGPGPPPRIHLREPLDDREPLVMPRSTEMPREHGAVVGRYQIQGEIARGGMGAILRGRDIDLGRELAIKVLLESNQGNSDAVRRFVEEAQIGGQLQHPGIVPVYELGTFPDRRPFFAMKLVKGRTLASLLHERTSPDQDLPRFVSIFEQICQTMAYAHARGVIHRDLKPSNVMVGSFGEVQVMDWGLAKVLPTGGNADEAAAEPVNETVITTVRSGSAASGSKSQAGSVLGTPSYMAPEQARGDMDLIDERADVFGLGAILCEILTGRPPLLGKTREEIREKAARGDFTDALRRLEASGANGELVGVARDCLAAEPERRPRNAGEVARRLMAYMTGVQERLRTAELARVEAQARAEEEVKRRAVADELACEAQARADEERKRRRMTAALAASVVLTFAVVGGGWAYMSRQRLERAALFNQAVGEVEGLRAEAQRVGSDLVLWQTARDAAHAVDRLLVDAPDRSTRRRATELLRDVTHSATTAENDQKLLAKLADIRIGTEDEPEVSTTDVQYADAFREAGIDVASQTPAEVGAMILARPSAVRTTFVAALDHWAAVRRSVRGDQAGTRQLNEAARRADPDSWRNQLRDVLQTAQTDVRLTRLKELARSVRVDELPAVSLNALGRNLLDLGDPVGSEGVLRAAQQRYPSDVWLNYNLAQCLERMGHLEEAVRYYMAARSLRPETAHQLAHLLERKSETNQAIAIFQDLARLRPKDCRDLTCLGGVMKCQGRTKDAKMVLDAAIASSRAEIGRKPESPRAHYFLGVALADQGKLDEAVAEYRTALRLDPEHHKAHLSLGVASAKMGKIDEAIAEFRTALRLRPECPESHFHLGCVLRDQGKLKEAISEFREAIHRMPDSFVAHIGLGVALVDQGKVNEAISEFREAIQLKPDRVDGHYDLGIALNTQGKLNEAVAEFREAIRLEPDHSKAHANLGLCLHKQGKLDESVAEQRELIRLKPDEVGAHFNLGNSLMGQGKLDQAIAEIRASLTISPDDHNTHNNLGNALRNQGKLVEAIAEYREAIRLKPDDAGAHNNLGRALKDQGKSEDAITEIRLALRITPDLYIAHSNLADTLRNLGKLDEAVAEYRNALRLKPDYVAARTNLGVALSEQGRPNEAITEFRTSLRLKPDDPMIHFNIATTLLLQGTVDEAITECRTALRLKPDFVDAHLTLGNALKEERKWDEAIAEYHTALRLKPDYADAQYNLGLTLTRQGELDNAIAAHREAIRLKPDFAPAHYDLGNIQMLRGDLDNAIAAYREALRYQPDFAEAHCNLGHVLVRQYRFAEALPELKRGHELGSKNPNWHYPSAEWVRNTERLVELDAKLPAILGGQAKPVDSLETLGFAQLCSMKKLHGASAHFWTEAFKAQPKLADDMNVQHRYNAACAAALAGSAEGKDDPPLDDEKRARSRKQAIDWLEADLIAWSKILESGLPQVRQAIIQTLEHWKADTDLIGLRDAAALAKLPADEQKACRALWAEVDALRAKSQSSTTKTGK